MTGLGMANKKKVSSVEHVQVVVLYDHSSGTIKHLHMVTTLRGATRLTQEEPITVAKTQARRRNSNIDHLAVALSNDVEHGRYPHRIDPNTKMFVPLFAEK